MVSSPARPLPGDRSSYEDSQRSNQGGDSDEDDGSEEESSSEEDDSSDEDYEDSAGGRAKHDDNLTLTKSEDAEIEEKTQRGDEEQFSTNDLNNSVAQDHSAEIWAYLCGLTPLPLTIPDDPCIRELTKLPRLRDLPHNWRARLSKRSWMDNYCHLKTITAVILFLVGEDPDWKVCEGLGCDTLDNTLLMSALHDFARGSEAFNGQYAFPRCIMLPDDMMLRCDAVLERFGQYQCVNSYYRRGKKIPFPGKIFRPRLELPRTPQNPGNTRPFRESSALRREGRPGFPSLPPSGATATPSRSPKRKASPPQFEDDLPSYRRADPSSPNHPAPWEEFTGFLPLRSSPPRGGIRSPQLGSDIPIMVAHSATYLTAQPQKRVRLVDKSGTGRGDFSVLTLTTKEDVHRLSSEQGSGRMLNCSVAKGKVDVRLTVRERGQAREEMVFSVSEDTQWVVKEGWACEVTKFEGLEGEAKVHVTGMEVVRSSQV